MNTSPNTLPEIHDADERENQLKVEKLKREIQLLDRQLSAKGISLEWLKAATGPVAIAALLWSITSGYMQFSRDRVLREDERFEKAVTRMSSATVPERLAGLASLQLFLSSSEERRRKETVTYLANALASEKDSTVRGAILDSVSHLNPRTEGQSTLNNALEAVRDRNRVLYRSFRSEFIQKIRTENGLKTGSEKDEVPIGLHSDEELAPLRATASAIAALVKNGALTHDLSNIYCVDCDFTGKTFDMSLPEFKANSDFSRPAEPNLSAVNFDNAILKGANFIGANLQGASFESADLIHVNFSGADLRQARLTDFKQYEFPIQAVLKTGHLGAALLPDFTCADLREADFTGFVLFGVYRNKPGWVMAAYPILHNANVAGAKVAGAVAFSAIPIADEKKYARNPIVNFDLPFESVGASGGYGLYPKNWANEPTQVATFKLSPQMKVRFPINTGDWASLHLILADISSARNLSKSDFPVAVQEFVKGNPGSFTGSPHPTPCTPRNSAN